jgi:hypothetical protein
MAREVQKIAGLWGVASGEVGITPITRVGGCASDYAPALIPVTLIIVETLCLWHNGGIPQRPIIKETAL